MTLRSQTSNRGMWEGTINLNLGNGFVLEGFMASMHWYRWVTDFFLKHHLAPVTFSSTFLPFMSHDPYIEQWVKAQAWTMPWNQRYYELEELSWYLLCYSSNSVLSRMGHWYTVQGRGKERVRELCHLHRLAYVRCGKTKEKCWKFKSLSDHPHIWIFILEHLKVWHLWTVPIS
jgi:hypothetical protein